jgi:preprotein translocase subunit SecD
MNRYPMWKYAILVIAFLAGLIYTLPNFFPPAPAVQVSSGKVTAKVDAGTVTRIEQAITQAGLKADFVVRDGASVRARFADYDTQAKAKDVINKALNSDVNDPNFIVALQLLSSAPHWLSVLHALPMNLGLDLQGGVHFLLQVDMKAPLTKKAEALVGDVRTALREKNLRHAGINKVGNDVEIRFRDKETVTAAKNLLADQMSDEQWIDTPDGSEFKLTATLKPEAARRIQEQALKQNITTLHNRINELGTKEPVIQQQGTDRIVVELPGLQDPAKAKDIIGRTATLEIHMVEAHLEQRSRDFNPGKIEDAQRGLIPPGTELLVMKRDGKSEEPLLISKQIVFSGENLTGADANIDQQNGGSIVIVSLDAKGGNGMKNATREGVGRRMAVVLIEKGKPDVLTAPTIQSELSNRFHISGMRNPEEANDLALLMRAGSLGLHRWSSSKSARSARAWVPTTSPRVSTA